MNRGSLLLIGVLSAIITIISLNVAFDRSLNYKGYGFSHHYYRCDNNNYRNDNHKNRNDKNAAADSSTRNY